MNAERLLAHYEQVADAPDAVARVRRFVLDLAVRGKLVPQDANDEPASELLRRIAREKARLAAAGKIRAPKAIPPLTETPFSIPSNWRWSQLAEIGVLSPRNEAPDAHEVSFVPMPLIAGEYGVANGYEVRPWREIKKGYTHFAEGDVGLAKITPCFENGKSTVFRNLAGGIGAGTTELHVVRPIFIDQDYILLFLKSPHFIETGIPKMTGTAGQKRVPTEYFAHSPFPMPPLGEQHRIVAKVDELMGLCDRLETAQAVRETGRDRLAAASLNRLNASEIAVPAAATSSAPEASHAFADDARFFLDALPTLTARPDQIKALRQTILNLAVRGKLVPQNTDDELASTSLARFAKSRAKTREGRDWSKEYKLDKAPAFDLPAGWCWTTIDETSRRITVGYVGTMRDQYIEYGVPFLRSQNVRANKFREDGLVYISPEFHHRIIKSVLHSGDVVVVRSGNVGTACVIPPEIEEANCSDLVVIQRPECVVPDFMCYYLNSLAMTHVEEGAVGIALTHFNTKSVATMPLPLPPLAEQRRIVAKVDTLMALCDKLEASLTAAIDTRRRLLDALLAEALKPDENHLLEAAE
jgi:type I restriction enzyme S subunit